MMLPLMLASLMLPNILEVGPGAKFSRIETAMSMAKSGDTIRVHAMPDNYAGTAVRITIPNLRIVGVGTQPVKVVGRDFEYSGEGSVPRAIFQIEPGGEGSTILNFDLSGTHNKSFNGAGGAYLRGEQLDDLGLRDPRQ